MTTSTAEIIPLPTANLPADLPQLDDLAVQILANCKEHYARSEEMFSTGRERLKAIQTEYDKEHFTPLRIARGRLLLEAQKLVPKGQWQKWCEAKLNRNTSWSYAYQFPNGPILGRITLTSQRDLRACMELARAADPIAAHEEEKARARDGMRKVRKQRRNAQAVTPAPTSSIDPADLPELGKDITVEELIADAKARKAHCDMGGQRQDANPANASPPAQSADPADDLSADERAILALKSIWEKSSRSAQETFLKWAKEQLNSRRYPSIQDLGRMTQNPVAKPHTLIVDAEPAEAATAE